MLLDVDHGPAAILFLSMRSETEQSSIYTKNITVCLQIILQKVLTIQIEAFAVVF